MRAFVCRDVRCYPREMRSSLRGGAALLLLLPVTIAACSSDEPDDGSPNGTPVTDVGKACTSSAECQSGNCVPLSGAPIGASVRGVCSRTCAGDADCVAGWACTPTAGGPSLCACAQSAEVCDGKDNDCNAVVDDEPATSATCGANAACQSGTCNCTGGAARCDSVCVDTQIDPNNCGGCGVVCGDGRSCVGGACRCGGTGEACATEGKACGVAGRCLTVTPLGSAEPTTFAGEIEFVEVGDTHLVVGSLTRGLSSYYSMAAIPKTSANGTALDSGPLVMHDASIAGSKLAYSRHVTLGSPGNTGGAIYACDDPTCAGGKRTLLDPSDPVSALFLVGDTVYWKQGDTVVRCAHAGCGGAPTTVGTIIADLFAADSTSLYGFGTDGAIVALSLADGFATTITSASTGRTIRLDDANVYWSSSTGISSCPKSGCATPTPIVATPNARAFAVDATHVYWPEVVDNVTVVRRARKDVSTPAENFLTLRALHKSGVAGPIGIDAEAIYVAADQVYRVGK